jgi:two-component system, NarL family, nitrate/nitrite response regulator NarL
MSVIRDGGGAPPPRGGGASAFAQASADRRSLGGDRLAPRSLRVVVAAPTPLLAAGLAALVRDGGFTVVAERSRLDEPSALDAVDVAVMAAGTPIAIDAFRDGEPGAVVVGADRALAALLGRDGTRAVGVVPDDAGARTIGAAIGAVAAGLSVRPAGIPTPARFGDDGFQPAAARTAADDGLEDPIDAEPLTPREAEVLDSLAQGLSNRAIAARLAISEHTVKFHLASIFGKLGATTRTGAVRRALRRGLIDL